MCTYINFKANREQNFVLKEKITQFSWRLKRPKMFENILSLRLIISILTLPAHLVKCVVR